MAMTDCDEIDLRVLLGNRANWVAQNQLAFVPDLRRAVKRMAELVEAINPLENARLEKNAAEAEGRKSQ